MTLSLSLISNPPFRVLFGTFDPNPLQTPSPYRRTSLSNSETFYTFSFNGKMAFFGARNTGYLVT
jgi:hypothetical protein